MDCDFSHTKVTPPSHTSHSSTVVLMLLWLISSSTLNRPYPYSNPASVNQTLGKTLFFLLWIFLFIQAIVILGNKLNWKQLDFDLCRKQLHQFVIIDCKNYFLNIFYSLWLWLTYPCLFKISVMNIQQNTFVMLRKFRYKKTQLSTDNIVMSPHCTKRGRSRIYWRGSPYQHRVEM